MQATPHQKNFSSHSTVVLHARLWLSFSSENEHCAREVLKSCFYKQQASFHCFSTCSCSLCRWYIQDHGSLKSDFNQLFGPKNRSPHKQSCSHVRLGLNFTPVKDTEEKSLPKSKIYYTDCR